MVLKIKFVHILIFMLITLLINPIVIESNPIPAPTIILHYEYMNFNITRLNNSVATVSYYGKFLMENVGYKDLVLYFPVPNETLNNGHVFVMTNGEKPTIPLHGSSLYGARSIIILPYLVNYL